MTHGEYALFAGLDVSMNRTSLCLVDASGDVIWRDACATDPELLGAMIRRASGGRICAGERAKLLDSRKLRVGDIYNPGHGRRLQIRNKHRQILGYIEPSGKITDTRRRKVRSIEGLNWSGR